MNWRLCFSSTRGAGALRVGLAIATTCSVLAHVSAVRAEPAASDTEDSFAVQYRKGYDALSEKDFAEARRIFHELWQRYRTSAVAASLSQAEAHLGNRVEAAGLMAFAVAHAGPNDKPAVVERYKQALAELRAQVASLSVDVNEAGAEIRVDGSLIGRSPLAGELFIEPGERAIEARLGADRMTLQNITALAGQHYSLKLQLTPVTTVRARSRSEDETQRGVPAVDAAADRTFLPVYIASGMSALGLGFGIAFSVGERQARQDSGTASLRVGRSGCVDGSALASDCAAARRSLDDQRRYAVLADIGWTVAALGAGAAVAALLWPEPPERAGAGSRWHTAIGVGPDGARFGVTGSF